MKDLIYIFPDTNIFLHFPPMKDIDWCSIAGSKSVELVVCMTVIHELDAKKSDSRLSSRAERAISEIRSAYGSDHEIRSGVKLSVYNKEVKVTDFPDTLSPEVADDRIVHLVKLYSTDHPGIEVAIATSDLGMELRASVAGVKTIPLDHKLRLGNPQDEQSRKLKQVQTELIELKNRQPKLSLKLSHINEPAELAHELIFEMSVTVPHNHYRQPLHSVSV